MAKITLGDKVKDSVTGFTGIAIARTQWLHGCDRVTVQPDKLDKDGKVQGNETFDELQLEVIKAKAVATATKAQRANGGPRDDRAALRRV